MKGFNPIIRQRVSPINLETVANTYRELEQGHQKSMQLASQLQTAMAQLPLNEAEDEWRQNKIQQIRNTLDNNLNYGNAAGAYDDLVKAQGDITSDPGLIGRIRAQQDYTAYLNNINERQDLSEYHKNYYRANTKYRYNDIYNDKGQVIGGTKWEPNERPVSNIDMNKIYNEALKYVSPDAGGYENTTFIDISTGKVSNTYTENSTMARYNSITGKYEILPPEKIRAAVDAAIKANPAIRASLEQDYKIDKWYHSQNPNIANDVIDPKGYTKSFDQYVNDKIDPFIRAKQYRRIYTSTAYNDSMINEIAKAKVTAKANNSGNNQQINNFLANTIVEKGPRAQVKIDPGLEVLTGVRTIGSTYTEKLNEKYPNVNIPEFNLYTTPDALSTWAKNNNISGEVAIDVMREFDNFKRATLPYRATINNVIGDVNDPNKIDAFNFISQVNSGIIDDISPDDTDTMKEWKQSFANITDRLFGDNSAGIAITLKNQRDLDTFKRNIGDLWDTYEIKQYNTENGDIRLVLSSDHKDGTYKFVQAAKATNLDSRVFGGGLRREKYTSIRRVDKNGNIVPLEVHFNNPNRELLISQADYLYTDIIKQANKLQEDILPVGDEVVVDTSVSSHTNPEHYMRDQLYQTISNPADAKLEKDRRDDIVKRYTNIFKANPQLMISGDYLVVDKNGTLRDMTSDEIEDARIKIPTYNDSNIKHQLTYVPTMGWKIKTTVTDDSDVKEYILKEGLNDPSIDAVNNSISTQAKLLLDNVTYAYQAFSYDTPYSTDIVVKDKHTGKFILQDEDLRTIKEDISLQDVEKLALWSVVENKVRNGEYTENDKEAIGQAYYNSLIIKGFDPETAMMFTNEYIKKL